VEEEEEWGGEGRVKESVGESKVERGGAVLKIPLKSPGPGPLLTLRQIDAPVFDYPTVV